MKIKTKPENKKFYKFCYYLVKLPIIFFRPIRSLYKEKVCDNAALICANHSAMIDPFLIALTLDANVQFHVIAKKELFKIPVISTLLWKAGMICVNRDTSDVSSIKSILSYLKKGEKVLIFPEGTRLSEYDASTVKNGAVKIAERAGVPIVPVFVPRKKPFFKKSTIVFGDPYYINKQAEKRSADDYAELSKDLMNRIHSLESLC